MAERTSKAELGIEELCERVRELESRIAALEEKSAGRSAYATQEAPGDSVGRSKEQPLQENQDAGLKTGATTERGGEKPPLRGEEETQPRMAVLRGEEEKSTGRTASDVQDKKAGSTNVVAVVGKAVLAMAGAYLLRAIAESEAAPRWILLVAAIAYAGAWLVWAARTHRRSHFASAIFGLTVAFILAPLLWEGTVRFGELTAGHAAAVLVGYVAVSLALGWKERLEAIPWIAMVAAVGTAMALTVATHELRALTMGLLVLAMVSETAAWSGRWLGLRAVTALGVDFAVLTLGLVMTRAEGVPEDYRAMSAGEVNAFCLALLVIYGVSMAVRGFVFGKRWTILEVGQAAVAFGVGTWLSVRATAGGSAGYLGGVFLVLAVVCYWGALRRFAGGGGEWRVASGENIEIRNLKSETRGGGTESREDNRGIPVGAGEEKSTGRNARATEEALADSLRRTEERPQQEAGGVKPSLQEEEETQPGMAVPQESGDDGRDMRWDRRVCANYAAGLVLAGSYLLLGENWQVVLLSLAAVAAVVVFTRTGYLSLGIHGTFYLLAAGSVCGMFGYAGRALAGTVPAWPEWSFWAVALAGLASYMVGSSTPGEGWRARILWVVPAAAVGSTVAAVVVAGIAGLGVSGLSASRLSMVRTAVTCVVALAMGYAGSRWNRVELGWVAYGAIGLGALKLAVEDLRYGNAATLMVSLLFYGLILVLLPRVTRFGRVEV